MAQFWGTFYSFQYMPAVHCEILPFSILVMWFPPSLSQFAIPLIFFLELLPKETACIQILDSVQFSHSVVSDSLQPHGLQYARLLCPSPAPSAYSNSCPLSRWCHPTISSSVIPFSFCLQSSPASGSFLVGQFFPSGGQSMRVSASASVLPMNIQDWFPSGLI